MVILFIGYKGKVSSAPNKTYVVIVFVPPLQIGAQTSAIAKLLVVSSESNLVDSHVSHNVVS